MTIDEDLSRIITAYIQSNPGKIAPADLPFLVQETRRAMLGQELTVRVPDVEFEQLPGSKTEGSMLLPPPKVDPAQSVFHDHLVCLACGKHFKSLKRHLLANHGVTPDQYRSAYGLPDDYPMTCEDYSAARASSALTQGFGARKAEGVEDAKGEVADGDESHEHQTPTGDVAQSPSDRA